MSSTRQIITITSKAAQHIKYLLTLKHEYSAIRVKVKTGGCSGKTYAIEYAQAAEPFDEIASSHDVIVFIDPKSVMHLIGTKMDYLEEEFKSGFTFTNPNEKNKCGCGKSFNV